MRLIDSLHLQREADGSARVIDDRTFTVAHVNEAARILLEALHRPRTRGDLETILAEAAGCEVSETAAPVARLVEDLTSYGWIETEDEGTDTP